ncbi:MAG TPA: TetR/AcrR family transcriptional regulator, partial [Micromonosporaceae bacterium]
LAGVSLRALWSHFADMEALFAASGQRILELRDAAYEPISTDLPLARRIEAYCYQRARLLEQIAPAAKAASLKEPFSPALQHYRRCHVERVRDEIKSLFAPELKAAGDGGPELLAALAGISMWPAWGTWRDTMGMDPDAARGALTRTVTALLSGA